MMSSTLRGVTSFAFPAMCRVGWMLVDPVAKRRATVPRVPGTIRDLGIGAMVHNAARGPQGASVPHPLSQRVRFSSPGTTGVNDFSQMLADSSNRVRPTPVGKPGKASASTSKTAEGVELNLWADFKKGPWATNKAVLEAAKAGRWYPDSGYLKKFAASGKGKVDGISDVWNLLTKIAANAPVRRVNIFTHAAKGFISLSGQVIDNNVQMNEGDSELSDFNIETAADNRVFSTFTIEDVRHAFTQDAEVVIYACHAGLDTAYLRKIGKLLGVKVRGFKKMIRYDLKEEKGDLTVRYGIEGAPQQFDDFHSLIPDAE